MSYMRQGSEHVQVNDRPRSGESIITGAATNLGVGALVQLSRAKKTDLIAVSGPSALELLSALFRSGFEQVICVPSESFVAYEQVDAIIMAGHHDLETFTQVLHRLAPHLKQDGVLACELPKLEYDRQLELCLNALGMAIESTVFNLCGKVLVRHTIGHQAYPLRAA